MTFLQAAVRAICSGWHPQNPQAAPACRLLPAEWKQQLALRSEDRWVLLAALKLPCRQHSTFCWIKKVPGEESMVNNYKYYKAVPSFAFIPSSPSFFCLQDTKQLNPPDDCSCIYIFICLVYRKIIPAFGRGSYQRHTGTAIVFYCSRPFSL